MIGKTLLTGFGPFGAVISNPTQRLAERFADEVETLVLPTSFARAPSLIVRALAERSYERVVMLGVAVSTPHFRVECFAHNADEGGAPDVDGFVPPMRAIAAAAPHRLPVTIVPKQWLDALAAVNVPVELSESAGGFLCNHALFHALHSSRGRPTQIGFLHVPADDATGLQGDRFMPFSEHVRAVRALLSL